MFVFPFDWRGVIVPTEIYVGAAVAVIVLLLLASLFRRKPTKRRVVQISSSTDQVAIQLSRIANSLEALVVQLRDSTSSHVEQVPSPSPPRIEQPSEPMRKAPVQRTVQSNGTEQTKSDEPSKRHVNLSMCGR